MNDIDNKKALGYCSIGSAIGFALIGLILGIVGLCLYAPKSAGWKLSLIGVIIATINMISGFVMGYLGIL